MENLLPLLPPHRTSVLELDLRKSTVSRGFAVPEDKERADLPDFQGCCQAAFQTVAAPAPGRGRLCEGVI